MLCTHVDQSKVKEKDNKKKTVEVKCEEMCNNIK